MLLFEEDVVCYQARENGTEPTPLSELLNFSELQGFRQ